MKQNKLFTKNILTNRLMFSGEKHTSEKLILKCFKNLLKTSKKSQKKIIKLFLINITPIFKLHKSSNKKVRKKKRKIRITPFFILKHQNRVSFGIKLMLSNLKKVENNYFLKNFISNIFLILNNESNILDIKNETQKTALNQKRYLKHFKFF